MEEDASLIILGGEPLIDPKRLFHSLQRGNEIFSRPILISTNGTLCTKEIARGLREHSVEVQVSLDSYDPRKNDRIRGLGSFEKAIVGIKRLVAQGVYTVLCMVYTKTSYRDFEPYCELACKLGANEVRFIPLRLIGAGKKLRRCAPDQYASFKHLLSILKRNPGYKSLLKRDFFSIVMNTCLYKANRVNCGIGSKTVSIDANGDVYPCPNHVSQEYLCGDIHTKSLEDIVFESPVMQQIRSTYNVSKYTQCPDCPYRYWCSGDCRGEVISLSGKVTGISPHCKELKRLYTEMLWVMAGDSVFRKPPLDGSERYSYPFRV